MSVLRYYLLIGGRDFRAREFDVQARQNGIASEYCGDYRDRVPGYLRHPTETLSAENFKQAPLPTAHYSLWVSRYNDCFRDADAYARRLEPGIPEVYQQRRLRQVDDQVVGEFLTRLATTLPDVRDYASGEHFIVLKLIHGGEKGICPPPIISAYLIQKLAVLGAGLETECVEPADFFAMNKHRHNDANA